MLFGFILYYVTRFNFMRLLVCLISTLAVASINSVVAFAQTDVDFSESSISVDRSSMTGAALWLKIEAPQNSKLAGTVKINGKVAGNLQKDRSVSLAKCLQVTTCQVEVSATYDPKSAVDISIYSTNGAMKSTQQSDGTGVLRQKFTVNIL
jgi:hypothetical protein